MSTILIDILESGKIVSVFPLFYGSLKNNNLKGPALLVYKSI